MLNNKHKIQIIYSYILPFVSKLVPLIKVNTLSAGHRPEATQGLPEKVPLNLNTMSAPFLKSAWVM